MTALGQATEARVYQYGCMPPIEGAAIVRAQFREGATYYNALIALERCRRQVYRDLRAQHVSMDAVTERVETLATALDEVRSAIKQERQTERRRVVTSALNTRAKEIAAELRGRPDLRPLVELGDGEAQRGIVFRRRARLFQLANDVAQDDSAE